MTPARPTSEPVPAVVGTATIGAILSASARVHQSPPDQGQFLDAGPEQVDALATGDLGVQPEVAGDLADDGRFPEILLEARCLVDQVAVGGEGGRRQLLHGREIVLAHVLDIGEVGIAAADGDLAVVERARRERRALTLG